MTRKTLLAPLAAVVLALGGCGGDDTSSETEGQGDQSGAGAITEESGSGEGEQQGSAGEVTVAMQNIQFSPKEATAKVGQVVVWVNEDGVEHDVEAADGTFDSDLFGKGESYKYTAEKAGEFDYVCTVHPGMTGTLTVTD